MERAFTVGPQRMDPLRADTCPMNREKRTYYTRALEVDLGPTATALPRIFCPCQRRWRFTVADASRCQHRPQPASRVLTTTFRPVRVAQKKLRCVRNPRQSAA